MPPCRSDSQQVEEWSSDSSSDMECDTGEALLVTHDMLEPQSDMHHISFVELARLLAQSAEHSAIDAALSGEVHPVVVVQQSPPPLLPVLAALLRKGLAFLGAHLGLFEV